jgi:hypothetical protein
MTEYECKRCGYSSKVRKKYEIHLGKTNICKPRFSYRGKTSGMWSMKRKLVAFVLVVAPAASLNGPVKAPQGASRGDARIATTTTTTTTRRALAGRALAGHALAGLVLVGTVGGLLDASALPSAPSALPSAPSVASGTDVLSAITGLATKKDISDLKSDIGWGNGATLAVGAVSLVCQFLFFSQLSNRIEGCAKSTEVLKVGDQ